MNELKRVTKVCVEALDAIIDENAENHALPQQKEMSLKFRNCGLGVMGLYDALAKLSLRYDNDEAIRTTECIVNTMFCAAIEESYNLARELGAFPGWSEKVVDSEIFQKHFGKNEQFCQDVREIGLRNCSLLSVAPAGSIATMLNVSTGCEPLFAKSYQRKTESLNDGEDKYYTVYAGIIQDYFNATGETKVPDFFVESHDIDWRKRVDMQAAIQEHVDTAISSTVNLKHEITPEEVELLYLYAWEKGLKGITIFRDGCARTGILTTDTKAPEQTSFDSKDVIPRGVIIKADDNCVGKKRTLVTGCGTLHCEAFFDPVDGSLLETYFSRGSKGGCNNSYTGLSRMISLAARAGVDIYSICDQLNSCGACPSYAVRAATKHDTSRGSCCPAAISNALLDMYKEMQKEIDADEVEDEQKPKPKKVAVNKQEVNEQALIDAGRCPICGEPLQHSGGCDFCPNDGWSHCG